MGVDDAGNPDVIDVVVVGARPTSGPAVLLPAESDNRSVRAPSSGFGGLPPTALGPDRTACACCIPEGCAFRSPRPRSSKQVECAPNGMMLPILVRISFGVRAQASGNSRVGLWKRLRDFSVETFGVQAKARGLRLDPE